MSVYLLLSIRTNQPEVQTSRKYKPTGRKHKYALRYTLAGASFFL